LRCCSKQGHVLPNLPPANPTKFASPYTCSVQQPTSKPSVGKRDQLHTVATYFVFLATCLLDLDAVSNEGKRPTSEQYE